MHNNQNKEVLREHIPLIAKTLKFEPSQKLIENLLSVSEIHTVKPGDFFCQAGAPAQKMFLVLKGLLRGYYLEESGKCSIRSFFVEGKVGGPYLEILNSSPSKIYIDALEESLLLTVNFKKVLQQNKKENEWLKLRTYILESAHDFLENRLYELLAFNSLDRVLRLKEKRPDLFNRVRNMDLASYLGMTPETFSRTLKKIKSQQIK